jgi:hypothetical protein
MFDTAHKISRIRKAYVVAANRIAAGEFGRAFLLLSRQATSPLLRLEKRASNGFGEMDPALRANPHVSRERENPYLFLRNGFIMSDTAHSGDAFLRFLIRWFVFCGAM